MTRRLSFLLVFARFSVLLRGRGVSLIAFSVPSSCSLFTHIPSFANRENVHSAEDDEQLGMFFPASKFRIFQMPSFLL